eukprot:c13138_g1_i1 orf=259-921(-)
MTVHQLWRFPRDTRDLAVLRGSEDNSSSFTPGLNQVGSEELSRLRDLIWRYHTHMTSTDQCCSMVVQRIRAPVDLVWPMVRRFDNPQAYKHFIKRCSMRGDGRVGSTREVELVSGLPAASSTERLEILDEERHILSFKIVGGEHRLRNYHSITTLHESELDGKPATIVIESYVVDVPNGNTIEDTRAFADNIVKYNLTSLARISEHQARFKQDEKLPTAQ